MKNVFLKNSFIAIISLYSMSISGQKYHSDKLEIAANVENFKLIGVSVTSDNRLFVSFPKQEVNYEFGLTEIVNGKRVPYPDMEWNKTGNKDSHFVNVQDLYVDANDLLWVLDSKPSSSSSIFGDQGKAAEGEFKLLKINTKTNQIDRIYAFDDLDKTKSALNDVRIDTSKNKAYLSDPGQAAIIVLGLNTGKTRKVLEKTLFTLADPSIILSYNGIETQYLINENLTEKEIISKVENMGNVGVTHGLIADKNGTIYLTTSLDYTIKHLTTDSNKITV